MEFDFAKTMQEISDTELIKILTTERDNYQKEAIDAAELEFNKRNLTTTQIENAKTYNEKEYQIQLAKSKMPLDLHWKILTAIIPGVIQLILSGLFKSEGYDRKAHDLTKWTLIGFGIYICITIVISLL